MSVETKKHLENLCFLDNFFQNVCLEIFFRAPDHCIDVQSFKKAHKQSIFIKSTRVVVMKCCRSRKNSLWNQRQPWPEDLFRTNRSLKGSPQLLHQGSCWDSRSPVGIQEAQFFLLYPQAGIKCKKKSRNSYKNFSTIFSRIFPEKNFVRSRDLNQSTILFTLLPLFINSIDSNQVDAR